MIRGDVYSYKFKEPNKRRPVLILTRPNLIPALNAITVAEITTTIRGNDSEVLLNEADGMRETCVVNLLNIQPVSTPAGIRIFTCSVFGVTPLPLHKLHGERRRPVPSQSGQVCENCNRPPLL